MEFSPTYIRFALAEYATIGHARVFTIPLTTAERDGLRVGSVVTVAGNSVSERTATVVALTEGGATLELVDAKR